MVLLSEEITSTQFLLLFFVFEEQMKLLVCCFCINLCPLPISQL